MSAFLIRALTSLGPPAAPRLYIAEQQRLSQVVLEAIRIVCHDSERCSECGLGPVGALRDALTRAADAGIRFVGIPVRIVPKGERS